MQLHYEVETLLRAAGYRTARPHGTDDLIEFEDETVLGFAATHPAVDSIVARWREQQDAFLRKHAAGLRRDPSKAWNTYAVFLTAAPVEDEDTRQALGALESDVSATRKVARGGVLTPGDLREALAPVLPLAAVRDVGGVSVDALFAGKLSPDEARLFELVRDQNANGRRVVSWLVEVET